MAQPANSYSGRIDQHDNISGLDIVEPKNASTMVDAYGNDAFYKNLLFWKTIGAAHVVNNSSGWSVFDEMPFNQEVTVKADAGTATTTLSFTLNTTLINTMDGNRTIYPAVGDYLRDMRTANAGRITAITDGGVDFTITCVSVTNTNWTVPSVGRQYALYTAAEYEGSLTLPANKDSYVEKRSFTMQRFAKKCTTTSDVLTDDLYIHQDENGNAIGSWGDKQLLDTERRMALDQVGAMWLGMTTTATTYPSTTNGMWSAFSSGASNISYTAGAPTIAQFQATMDALRANGAYGSQVWMLPKTAYRDWQTLFRSTGAAADQNIPQTSKHEASVIFENIPDTSAEGLMRTFDMNTVILDGQTVNLQLLNFSFDPRVFGCDGSANKFLTAGFVIPTARLKSGKGPKRTNVVEIGYKSKGKYNLMQTYGSFGWLADGGANTEENARVTGMRSHMGFGFRGLTQCAYLQVA